MPAIKKRHILMVDDDADLRRVVRGCFALEGGWRFSSRPSGEEALDWLSDDRPDVILLDYDLGEGKMSGFEFLRKLRAQRGLAGLPVVMLTGALPETTDAAAGLDAGADDFLVKPVSVPTLMARVKAAISKATRGASQPGSGL